MYRTSETGVLAAALVPADAVDELGAGAAVVAPLPEPVLLGFAVVAPDGCVAVGELLESVAT